MGHSVAEFIVPTVTAEWVLQAAATHGAQQGMRIASASPISVALTKGSIWWTSERWMSVTAWNVPGGANVHVEAWIQGIAQLNADPVPFVGMIPQRDAWEIASSFVARFGVDPRAVFQHW